MEDIQVFRESGGVATISLINTTVGKRYLALSYSKSKTFKTLNGALKFLSKLGYKVDNILNSK